MTPIIKSVVEGTEVTLGGILVAETYFQGKSNADWATQVHSMREPPVIGSVNNEQYVLAYEQILSERSSIARGDITSIITGEVDEDYILYYKSSSTSRSRRYQSVGPELFSGVAANTVMAVKKIRVDHSLTGFIDLMINEEASKAGPASSQFKKWVRGRLGKLADVASLVSGPLHAYVPIVITPDNVVNVSSPLDAKTLITRAGRMPWPATVNLKPAATNDEQLHAYLEFVDSTATNFTHDIEPGTVMDLPGMGDPALAVGVLNQLVTDQGSSRSGIIGSLGVQIDDLGFWYTILRAAFERDTTIQAWVNSIGYKSIDAAMASIDSPVNYVPVRSKTR